jgi:hypothetical protein
VEFDDDDSLAVGQREWLLRYRTKDKKEAERFVDFLDDRLGVDVEYCTVDDTNCRHRCSTKSHCGVAASH